MATRSCCSIRPYPKLSPKHRINLVTEMDTFEAVVRELIQLYNISAPPIPIERMLQHPHPDMWDEVDVGQLSSTFLNTKVRYSPRMSLARFLAREIAGSSWGQKRQLGSIEGNDPAIHRFARAIAMPEEMVLEINPESRTPQLISLHFEVPEEDARLRLEDLKVEE